MNHHSQNMFNSEVELSKFLGSSIGTIEKVYDVLLNEAKIRFGLYTSSSGIKVLAFMTRPLLKGDYDLEMVDKAIDFISTGAEDSLFSVNKNAIELFNGFSTDRLKEIENEHILTPLIITGWGLGGMLAILCALRLQRAVDVEESKGIKGTKRPMCITFGAPLVGGENFQQAIAKRPQWKSGFLNVVVKKDIGARCFATKEGYKPFGTFLFCTESGDCTALEDVNAIMAVLDTMASPDAESLCLQDYKQVLSSIRRKVLIRGGPSDLGEGNMSFLKAGFTLLLRKVGVSDNSLIGELEKQAKKSKKNAYEPTKKLDEIKISMSYLEWYIKNERGRAGYYDCYKNERRSRDDYDRHQVILKHKRILNQYWKKFVEEKDQMPQKDGAKLRKRWLYSGNNYRWMIEPLDIGEYYKNFNEKENNNDVDTSYIANRPIHYKLLEKWLMEDKKNVNPSDEKQEAFNLSKDSCFWAHVEEAIISLRLLMDGSLSSNSDVLEQKLEKFMAYVMGAVKDFMVSSDIFLEGSSLWKWWNEYNEYKEGSCDSEFAQYMNSGRYKRYK